MGSAPRSYSAGNAGVCILNDIYTEFVMPDRPRDVDRLLPGTKEQEHTGVEVLAAAASDGAHDGCVSTARDNRFPRSFEELKELRRNLEVVLMRGNSDHSEALVMRSDGRTPGSGSLECFWAPGRTPAVRLPVSTRWRAGWRHHSPNIDSR